MQGIRCHLTEQSLLSSDRDMVIADGRPSDRPLDIHRDAPSDAETSNQILLKLIDLLAQDTAANAPPPPPNRINPEKLTGVLRRRWLPMLLMFLAGTALVAWLLRPSKPVYLATATILLPKSSSGVIVQVGGGAPTDNSNGSGNAETQIAIMTSPEVVSRSMKELSPQLRLAGWGAKDAKNAIVNAQTAVENSSELIDVSVPSMNPDASRQLANTLARVYMARMRELDSQSQDANLSFLDQKRREVRAQLDAAQRKYKEYQERERISDANAAISSTTTRIQELEQQVAAANLEAQAGASSPAIANDTVLSGLRQKAEEARTTEAALLRDFFPGTDRVQRASQVARAAQQLVDQRTALLVGAARKRANDLQVQLNEARSAAARLPEAQLKLSQLQSNVDSLSTRYRAISDRYESLNLSRNANTQTPTVLRPAAVQNVSGNFGPKTLLLSALSALMLSALLAALLERIDKTVHSADDLKPLLDTPVLGVLPMVSSHVERRLTHMTHASAEVAMLEACRVLQSNVITCINQSGARSLLVTSSAASEGKSLCALNLAAAMAFGSWRVLLIDCDFWHPTQHTLNEVSLTPGYSDVLAGRRTIESALMATSVNNLTVLSAGPAPSDVASLIHSETNRQLLQDLKSRFDVIIIDGPPVLSLSGAQVLATMADEVLMVVSASTPNEQVQRAQAALRLTGAKLMGSIFNKGRAKGSASTETTAAPDRSRGDSPNGYGELLPDNSTKVLSRRTK
jgi:capsular exopolysaccharide synthesis family protein